MKQREKTQAMHRQWLSCFTTFLGIGLLSSCAHNRGTDATGVDASLPIVETVPVTTSVRSVTIGDVLREPDSHINRVITIVGLIDSLNVNELQNDLTLLTLELAEPAPDLEPVSAPQTIITADISLSINTIGDRFMTAAGALDPTTIDVRQIEALAYRLRGHGSQLRALSHFLRANARGPLGNSASTVADGYTTLSDAYMAFAAAGQSSGMSSIEHSEFNLRMVTPTTEVEGGLQANLETAALQLASAADRFVQHRHQLVTGELILDVEPLSDAISHSLLSVGALLDAEGWERLSRNEHDAGSSYRKLSEAYSLLGQGVAGINGGMIGMVDYLNAERPAPRSVSIRRTLRCAFVGYNGSLLRECGKKLGQMGAFPVSIRGRLHRGALREELDLLWLEMDAINVDGMSIDVAYGNDSNAARNLSSFYGWLKELDN